MTQTIPISTIEDHLAFFQPWSAEPRTERHTARIELYKEAMKEGRVPPPIVVCEVDGGARILLDGRHRLTAYRELGRNEIAADLHHVATYGDAVRLGFQALGPARFCAVACEDFLKGTGGRSPGV